MPGQNWKPSYGTNQDNKRCYSFEGLPTPDILLRHGSIIYVSNKSFDFGRVFQNCTNVYYDSNLFHFKPSQLIFGWQLFLETETTLSSKHVVTMETRQKMIPKLRLHHFCEFTSFASTHPSQ